MVLLNSTRYFNRWLGPFLLRNGVRLRKRFVDKGSDHPYVDTALGVTLGQWLTALEAKDHANDLIEQRQQQASLSDPKSTSKDESSPLLSLEEESDLRVKVLDNFVRPALLPNNSWGIDVADNWQFYPRLVRWLRHEYLDARFGPHVRSARQAFPSLILSPQFSFDIPPSFLHLPKTSLVEAALCDTWNEAEEANHKSQQQRTMWASTKNRDALVRSMQSMASRYGGKTRIVRDGALCWNEIPAETSLQEAPLSHILDLVGANVLACGPINTWLEQRGQYQLWTKEYIAKLGDYLLQRSQQNDAPPTTILEVGAGDGLLTALLQDYVHNHSYGHHPDESSSQRGANRKPTSSKQSRASRSTSLPTFVATDDESWSIRKKATVVKQDYRQALSTYNATNTNGQSPRVIVLCSWMPMNQDWTAAFRGHEAVDEYILIGEADDGQCGEHWHTWGNLQFAEDADETSPPSEADGFERVDLKVLSPYQFSRYDSALSKEGMTVAFRRKHRL